MGFVDYYQVLGVPLDADLKALKAAFKKQALKWHPDKNPGKDTTEQMQLINEARLILFDDEARRKYDLEYQRYKRFKREQSRDKEQTNRTRTSTNTTYDQSWDWQNDYKVQDETLERWMNNAKRQAVDLAKQTIEDFKNIAYAGAKAGLEESGRQLMIQVVIAIFFSILFGLGMCGS